MINDRLITISYGNSRRSMNWQPQKLMLSELWEKLRIPTRGNETLAEYLAMKKAQQDDLKDVGGFVGGTLNSPRRKANNIIGRDVITIDLDNIPAGGTEDVLRRIEALSVGYCVYSTRKHHGAAPRLRILIPFDRTVFADEYEPCARKMAEYIGIEMADPTTFEVARLMYFPSCCSDSQFIYCYADKPFVSADGLLAQYADWRDFTKWPRVLGEQKALEKKVAKQEDPTTKSGIVGAFCRTYDVYRAMDELIPGIYEPVENTNDRFTFTGGSTTGGAVVYNNGLFLFSHHATDPCGGKLVNAFDLVRLHKFGDLDDRAEEGTRGNRLPSFLEMCKHALSLPEVSAQLDQERYLSVVEDFTGVTVLPSGTWMTALKRNDTGIYEKTAQNVQIMLENDPRFINKIGFDDFSHRAMALGELPWNREYPRPWTDADRAFLQIEVEKLLKFSAPQKIDAAFTACAAAHAHHPVRVYLNALPAWDNMPRLDTLYIDYLGAADTPYTRAVTRKGFVAAVARVMTPGCKFDTMTMLVGPQGAYKSTLIRYMAGDSWFNDSIKTLSGKDAMEALRGTWFIEFAELEAFNKADVTLIKSYLSSVMDRFRVSYGHFIQDFPRQCVFFGTSNKPDILRDSTGGRRFWIVQTDRQRRTKDVTLDLPRERDLIWSEAVMYWRTGEKIFLSGDLLEQAKAIQEAHRETDPWESIVKAFIEKPIPTDWDSWTLDKRKIFWSGTVAGADAIKTIPRERICAAEIWCEALNKLREDLQRRDSVRINDILATLPGWERIGHPIQFSLYGNQKGFRRLSW